MSPWTVKDRRRRNYARLLVMLAMGVALVGVVGSAQADEPSDSATALADGLRSFSARLNDSADALGQYQALAQSLPLVDLAPGSADALRLSSLLQEQLTAGANALDATYDSLAELESDLEALDELQDGVQFTVGDVSITGAPTGTIDVVVPISATRHVDQPLDFSAGIASIDGGELAIAFSLATTLRFRLDSSGGAPFPATAFSLVVPAGTPPVIDVCADVDAEIDAFTARLGFTDVTLTTDNPTTGGDPEKAKLDACAKITFSDPDTDGVLTKDEFASHALTEIATAALVDGDTGGNDLEAIFYLDASLVNGDGDGDVQGDTDEYDATISFTDLNLADASAPAVSTNFGSLVDFTNITPGDVANGLSQFIAAFGGSQIAGDGAIPFVKDGLNRAFEVVAPLKDYARQLTDAEVVCGTDEGTSTSLPTGSTANLKAGDPVYCRAKTAYTVSTTTVAWDSSVATEGDRTSGVQADTTIGADPADNAEFEMIADGSFEVEVEFDADPDAGGPQGVQTFTAIPRPQTAEELFDELEDAIEDFPFDSSFDPASGLSYDATTKSLSYRLKGSFDPAEIGPTAENAPTWDFGDQLRNVTHLAGLSASASATTTLNAGQVNWDATFGVILTGDEADITPATGSPSLIDRFFVKVRTGADQHEISLADLTVNGNVQLDGQVGFLGVHAGGSGPANTYAPDNGFPDDTAIGVMKANASQPVVSVNINPGSGVAVDTDPGPGQSLQTIGDAILVADLAFNLDDTHLDAVCNLKATAGLNVRADVGGGQTLAQAGVAVNWPQVFKPNSCTPDPANLQITPSGGFNTDFAHFDPYPTVTGTATAVAANPNEGTVLIDAAKNPTGGVDPTQFDQIGNLLDLTLRNKTTGATCKILTVAAQELTCVSALSGGSRQGDLPNNNKWKVGDEYEVEGNALALLSVILDNLDELVEQLEALGADVDATIPLVDMSTEDLVAKIQSIKRTIDDLRGFPKAQIQCDLDGNFSTPEDVSVVPDGTPIHCRATTQNTPDAVRWTVEVDSPGSSTIADNGEKGLDPDTIDDEGALTTVGPSPTTAVQFTVNDGDPASDLTTLDEWQLSLEWSDEGGANTAEFPPLTPPGTLQQLEELIEDKLGIADPNVFKLDLRDLPTPGVAPVKSGTADGDTVAGSNTLHDEDNFDGVISGMTAIRTTDPGKGDTCSITSVTGDDAVVCNVANGWNENDGYEIVGNGTKDLVIKLGAGFCGEAGGLTCDDSYRELDPLSVPLDLDVGALGDLVSFDSNNNLDLGYKAKATLEIGIPLALAVPVPVIVDTTGLELEGRASVDPIDLSAGIGPVQVNLGAAIADKDPDPDVTTPGEGKAKVGAKFTFGRGDEDGVPGNRTYDFAGGNSFFTGAGGLAAEFEGVDQDCGGSTTGGSNDDACLVADLGVEPTPAFLGDIVLTCDIQPLPAAPTCAAPSGSAVAALQAAIDGDPLNFALLVQLLPQLLGDLSTALSGAAQDVELPLVGEALDGGAEIVDTFNQGVVIPFADLVNVVNTAGDIDGDTIAEPGEAAQHVQQAIWDLIGPSGSVEIGGDPVDLVQDLNGDGDVTIDDVSVVALCEGDLCADGATLAAIDDFRITIKLGQQLDKNVPFDLGLDGVPLSLKGGLHASGGWSLLLDFGLSRDGPYLVKSGPQSVTGPLDGVTGPENEVNMPFNADGPDDDDDDGDPSDADELPDDAWAPVNYLHDLDATFTDKVEVGSWLTNVTTGEGCRITRVEAKKLHCADFVGAGGIMWNQTGATDGDVYEVVALHPPDKGQPGGAPELDLNASLGMGENAGACANDPDDLPGSVPGLENTYSTTKCLEAKVAFLTATARDAASGDASCADATTRANFASGLDPTTLCLAASMDITSSGTDPRITLGNLGDADLTLHFTVDANVDARFRTGIGSGPDFPSVLGAFHLYWGFTASTEAPPVAGNLAISFDQLHLDAGAFIGRFLGPIVKDVQNITKPLQPVIETLQAEVPIVSDLSKLVGEGPVTMLDLLEAISDNDLSLVRSVLQLVRFVNALPNDSSGLLIPLGNSPGSFEVSNQRAMGPQPTPDQAGGGIQGANAGKNLTDQLSGIGANTPSDECEGRGNTFGVCGLTFPFLADATQIFGVLMGQDVTLVRYDAGTLRAGAGFGYCFPPLLIGPVPVEICIGGSFQVEGRFAIGYDTSGIRKLLEGGSGVALLDGIFIDDYNAAGEEVPEIRFTGTVYAEGAVTVAIISVGIRGEIIFTTDLDLDDRPNPDGKLRIEEIVNRLSNPICLFVVKGQIDAALSAFVEIDLFFFTKRFSIEIVRITLLKFEVKCEPEVPNLADVVDGGNKLVLNVGDTGPDLLDERRDDRNIQENVVDEKMVVRQMEAYTSGPNSGKTRFSIAGFGIKEDEFLNTSAVNAGTAIVQAYGTNGDDSFTFVAGGGNEGTEQDDDPVDLKEFTPKVVVFAGGGADEITTGDGDDEVHGQGGNDHIITGKGNDLAHGGPNDDAIDAGEDDDTDVAGGPGNDTINGGPGGDTLFGGPDDDNISAGPDDEDATFVDNLYGQNGNDTLSGDGGADNLFGDDDNDDCAEDAETADPGGDGDNIDALLGGTGNDNLYGGPEGDQIEGNEGDDTICGNGGGDEILGNAGDDNARGGTGDDNITGGSDPLTGPDADPVTQGDTLRGGSGRDYMLGDDGTLTRDGSNNVAVALSITNDENDTMEGGPDADFMWGQGGVDALHGNDGNDEMRGGNGVDTMNGNADDDEMYGEDGDDLMHGNEHNDYMRGGTGVDTMDGDANEDEMYGDNSDDVMRGGGGSDLMRGGSGDDDMEGNENGSHALPLDNALSPFAEVNFDLDLVENTATGAWTPQGGGDGDVMFGDANEDDIIGGSRGATPPADGGDTIFGNHAQDVIVADNGTIARAGEGSCPAEPATDPDGTKKRCVTLTDATAGGADFVQGNDENDDIYAGGSGDLAYGQAGDDYIEGNGGSDGDGDADTTPDPAIGLYGDTGQDDIIGGTSQGSGGVGDGGDDIWGGMGEDVAAGDNATITRSGGGTCDGYVCNTFRDPGVVDVVIRRVQLWDVATTTSTPTAGTSGGDTIGGQDAHDRLYGQGGDDSIEGGGSDDFAFGNAGGDTIRGGPGQDDLIGGTGRTDTATASTAEDGRLDDGDVIFGEADFDTIAGDNSRMVRQTTGADPSDDTGEWKTNSFNDAVDRLIALMDVGVVGSPAGAGTSGNDQLLGGDADDVVYGQGGNDGISGGAAQDILEGNANGEGDAPEPGGAATYAEDADWPAFAGDVIHGDAGADDIAGGTGWIYTMVGGVETGDPLEAGVRVGTDGRLDGGDTIFGDGGGDAAAGDNTVIERALQDGEWILDDVRSTPVVLADDLIRRITRALDVATATSPLPLTNGTSGGDVIYGNAEDDVAYGQGGDDTIAGNAADDHLEGNAGDDTITGNEGQDDVIGGTGRTFSNDETTAAAGRIDESDPAVAEPPSGDPNDTLHGGDGLGGVESADDDVIIGDNGTVDRELGTTPTADRLPFNGTWAATSWDEPTFRRVVRLLDVATTANTAPETNGTNGADTINGEANEDVIFGQGGNDAITGDDADLDAGSAADANPGDDYIEGNGAVDTIRGDLGQDDITGGGSAASGVLDADRDGRFDDNRNGETLRDAGDTIEGDSNDGTAGDGDVVAGDNARIQRKLDGAGDWRVDTARGTRLRDVVLFDIRLVGAQVEPALGNAVPGESGADAIDGNGGNDILLGQDNGQADTIEANAFGTETGAAGTPDCQDATGGPGSGTLAGLEEAPNGDNDDDDLPDLNDPECRVPAPGDTINGETGQDYIEGNSGSDTLAGNDGEDDVVGGSSSNDGHLNVILPPGDRDGANEPTPPFAPTALAETSKPFNLNDGHDVIEGNEEDDTVLGDNGFVDRYLTAGTGAWITIAGAGHAGEDELEVPNPEPAKAAFEASELVRRDVVTKAEKEDPGAFGNDYVRGGTGQDDVYGTLGNDWLEGNENEDAMVGDMGKIVDNVLGVDGALEPPDPPQQFITPQQPFLGATVNQVGVLKREVELYAFNQSLATAGIGHDVALGGDGNDWIHTGPGEDLANGNDGDDRLFLGDNETAVTAKKTASASLLAHDKVDAGWGGLGYDHVWGGYGADYSDVRPRTVGDVPGLFPASDPETWFQIAGAGPTDGFPPPAVQELSENGVDYGHGDDNFGYKDYHYGGWDQDTLQANISDNGPHIGDRLLDWGGSYNGYYLCASTYGDWVSTRALAPGVIAFLQAMSEGDGATTTATAGSSGFRETAIVFTNEQKDNTKPIHVDTPAHFTCGPGITDP